MTTVRGRWSSGRERAGRAGICAEPANGILTRATWTLGVPGVSCIASARAPAGRTVLTGQAARFALASIRMVNGGLALTAPGVIIGRFDEPTSDSAAAYGLRMFGFRTVLLGADLAVLTGKPLRRALGQAVIHGTDTATPALPGVSRRAKPRTAIPLTLICTTHPGTARHSARRAGTGNNPSEVRGGSISVARISEMSHVYRK